MSEGPLLVIAAGGTGGHMFPAEALARAMLARGWRVMLTTDGRGARYAKGFPAEVPRVELAAATLARGGLLAKLRAPFRVLAGAHEARARFREDRPAVVAGFGGYPSLPALLAAWRMGLPRLIHEQNGVLGRVNRLFATRVDRVVCGTWPLERAPEGAQVLHLGNPVRAEIAERAGKTYMPPRAGGLLHVLVMGGSQGARVLSRYVPRAMASLDQDVRQRLRVVHQAREEDLAEAAGIYEEAGIRVEIAPFFEDIPSRLARAHLVISRAGASSVAEIAAMARPAILIPYAHAMDDHQRANAAALELIGGAVVMPEGQLTREKLASRIQTILTDPDKAEAMSRYAAEAAHPNATADLADLVETLGTGGAR